MKRMQHLTAAAPLLALGVATTAVRAEPILYATAGAGTTLVRIDVGAQKVTTLGDFGVPGADAIAINAKGEAYTITHGWPPGGDSQLARVNLATGVATPFGVLNKPENFMGLGFAPHGTLYGVNAGSGTADAGSLYRFDLATGAATKVGVTGGCFDIMDLAWHPDGTLYAIEPTALYRVDPVTGKRTLVKSLTGLSNPMGLTIDHDGTMYAADHVDQSPIKRIDPVTRQTTLVVQTRVNYIHGLCIAPAPVARITRADDRPEIAWPAWAAGHVLQSAPHLGGDTVWVPVPSVSVTEGDRVTTTWGFSDPARYFQLMEP